MTLSAGVPTVWQGLLTHVEDNDLKFSSMRRTVIGGAACPPAMMRAFQDRYDVQVLHAWGMTEMSPLGTICTLKPKHARLSAADRMAVQAKQGRAIFGVDLKIVGDDGKELPRDGKASGDLHGARPMGHRELLQARGRRSAGGRLVPDRRREHDRRRRIHADHRSQQGRHQVRRRMDWFASTSRTSRWRIRRSRWPPVSAPSTRSGTNGRCWSWSKKPKADLTGPRAAGFLRGQDRQVVDAG